MVILVGLAALLFFLIVIDNGPFQSTFNNIVYVVSNSFYSFVIICMIFCLYHERTSEYKEGEKEKIA